MYDTVAITTMQTANGVIEQPAVRVAIAMAIHLDEIRQIYGAECANYVQSVWLESSSPRWEETTYSALKRWVSSHPRLTLDFSD